jgi:PIN domain nuclease of toxin-antitoxin system
MRLLLDTHVFLWAVAGSPLLKAATRQMLQAADALLKRYSDLAVVV